MTIHDLYLDRDRARGGEQREQAEETPAIAAPVGPNPAPGVHADRRHEDDERERREAQRRSRERRTADRRQSPRSKLTAAPRAGEG